MNTPNEREADLKGPDQSEGRALRGLKSEIVWMTIEEFDEYRRSWENARCPFCEMENE